MGFHHICGAVASALACVGYACTSDTFVGDDGGDSSADAGATVTQAGFCDAEATLLSHCQIDASCAAANLNNCGSVFAALNPAFAAAIIACIDNNQLDCKNGSALGSIATSPCVQSELAGFVNDGGAFVRLTSDYCKACGAGSTTCAQTFTSATDQPGYVASLFADSVIQQIDTSCAQKLDGGSATAGDASFTCRDQFFLCEYFVLGVSLPADACKDGGL